MSDVIDDIIKREGGLVNDPLDKGGRTEKGISERSNPEAWADGYVTEEEARAIYQRKYIDGPGFNKITDKQLQAQLIDFGVNSGPMIAIQKLQQLLGVKADGVLGNETLVKISRANTQQVNNQLVISRVKMICQLVQRNPSQLRFLCGWVNRATEFLI